MTDIREAREIIAEAIASGPQTSWTWEGRSSLSRDRFLAKADRAIAALSEAGMTICGEQVAYQISYGRGDQQFWGEIIVGKPPREYTTRSLHLARVPAISDPQGPGLIGAPWSDPQEGDK